MLELHFIKSGIVLKISGVSSTITLSDNREESDYGAFVIFTEEDMIPLLPETEEFIAVIKRLIIKE